MDEPFLRRIRSRIERELQENILDFWMGHAVDEKRGGFHGYISNSLAIGKERDRASVMNSRILWAFSAAFRAYWDGGYLRMANRAYETIVNRFIDRAHGGVYWTIDHKGNPKDTTKRIYAQAFAMYGLSEYYMATQNPESLMLAISLFEAIERHSYDGAYKGYFDAKAADWSEIMDMRLSGKDRNAAKTMNTHLHLLEAYTSLSRVWHSRILKIKMKELLEIILAKVLRPDASGFRMFFDKKWNPLADTVSFGHDIEGSWLMCEAAAALGDRALIVRTGAAAVEMARRVLSNGLDPDFGGVYNEREPGSPPDGDKVWWVQAEAAVGFFNAWQMTGEREFLDASLSAWHFIDRHIADRENGEWFWRTDRRGVPDLEADEKAGPWKCPYHNGRMCLQLIGRIDEVLNADDRSVENGRANVR